MFDDLVASAYEYAYPLFAVASTRYHAVQNPENPKRHAPNTIRHERELADHTSRWITAPNNDTLYSNAWIDLSRGPVRIHVSEMPDGRYWSVALMDAFTNHFAMLGQRLDGRGPVEATLIGPGTEAPSDAERVIRAPGNDVWMFCRCLVDGAEDLPNAHAMQDRIEVLSEADGDGPARVAPIQSTDPANFLEVVNEALARNNVPESEKPLLQSWAEVGLVPGKLDAWDSLSEEGRTAWETRIDSLHDMIRQAGLRGRRDFQGWIVAAADIGNFGKNYTLRASVALGGLGALEPSEAMYFVRYQDDDRKPLEGSGRYRLHVPSGGIPTDSFWSFTIYAVTVDGRRILVGNPIDRYSIGNRTHGILHNDDGSLDIALQRDAPSDGKQFANWLPTPDGPFQVVLRTYIPRAELVEGRAAMPMIAVSD